MSLSKTALKAESDPELIEAAFEDIKLLRGGLQELADAAEPFLIEPSGGMPDKRLFYPCTTAGDCRELTFAHRKAQDVLRAVEAEENRCR